MTHPTLFDDAPTTIPAPRPATPKPPKSTWLLEHLIRTGHVTETGASRSARIRTCRTCHAHVITGLDGLVCAFEVTLDPQPLSPLGEALARVERRYTHHLRREGIKYVLDPRDRFHIRAHPAGTRTGEDIVREHRCHTEPLAGALTIASTFPGTTPPLPPGSPPPF